MSSFAKGVGVCGVVLAATLAGVCAEPANETQAHPKLEIGAPLKDVPFRAMQVIVRRGPDGVVETRGRIARNSAGSTYVELIDENTKEPAEVLIFDVPHRREVVLDLRTRRYRVVAAPSLEGRDAPTGFVADQLRVAQAEKDSSIHRVADGVDLTWKGLGVRRLGGLETVGSIEVQRPQPAPGETIDGPAEVDERWVSVDLGVAVMRVRHDPVRDEDTEITLTEVLRTEPDEQMFSVPSDFVLEGSSPHPERTQMR